MMTTAARGQAPAAQAELVATVVPGVQAEVQGQAVPEADTSPTLERRDLLRRHRKRLSHTPTCASALIASPQRLLQADLVAWLLDPELDLFGHTVAQDA